MTGTDEVMAGGRFAQPVRRGQTVERALAPGSDNVHALLRHFEAVGFALAPRYLGLTADGSREVVSFLDGETGYPPLSPTQRSDTTLVNVARAVRAMHDATAGFIAPDPNGWGGYEVSVPAVVDCIGHHDLAPWNIVFDGEAVVGIIDWDSARPSNRAWDLAYVAHQFVPLHPPAGLAPFGWDEEPDRRARLELLTASYGTGIQPAELVDLLIVRLSSMVAYIEQQIRADDPRFEVHRRENHGDGYRAAIGYLIDTRHDLVG